jgi:hypothetical protein
MQKLSVKLKNTPMDAPQVRSSVTDGLNKEETLSVHGEVRADNNAEVDQQQSQADQRNTKVFVLDENGKPIMPCSPGKARRLLRDKAAKVVKTYPFFVIQLNSQCRGYKAKITLGIDTGYGNIGFSAVSEKEELISGVLRLEHKTSERLTERRMYRRGRRARHHWYREPRFMNRKKPIGWLPPSVQRRYDIHLNLIKKIKAVLPISKTVIEVAKFDIQKIMNNEIKGKEYQQGNLYEYQNMRSYLMTRENGKCQLCDKTFEDRPSHIHHIIKRSEGGTNRADNLAILHEECHTKLHKNKLESLLKKNKEYKESTFMSIINKRFWKDLSDMGITYGNETFVKRQEIGLTKEHWNDAFVIAGGEKQPKSVLYELFQKRKNNRALQLNRKGYAPAIRKVRYTIQPKDLVWIDGKKQVTSGTHSKGTRVLVEGKSINIKRVTKHFSNKTIYGGSAFLPRMNAEVSRAEIR